MLQQCDNKGRKLYIGTYLGRALKTQVEIMADYLRVFYGYDRLDIYTLRFRETVIR